MCVCVQERGERGKKVGVRKEGKGRGEKMGG